MKSEKKKSPAPFCGCGCGRRVKRDRDTKRWNRFVRGHNTSMQYRAAGAERWQRVTAETLREMYFEKLMTPKEIGRAYGVTETPVLHRMGKEGIARLPRGEMHRRRQAKARRVSMPPGSVREMYEVQELPVQSVAEALGVSRAALTRAMDEYGIERRSLSEAVLVANSAGRVSPRTHPRGSRTKAEIRKRGYVFINATQLSETERSRLAGMIDKSNYIAVHRLVIARLLGRPLRSQEVVHHANGVKHDNRLENLVLMKSNSEHKRVWRAYRSKIRELEKRIRELEAMLQLELPLAVGQEEAEGNL